MLKFKGGGESEICNSPKTERYGSLDGLRALACIGIVLMHVKANIPIKPSDSWLMTNVISFTGNFVLLFMMISAFSLSCGYYYKFRDGTIPMERFYKKRYLRVLPFFMLLVFIDVLQTFASQGFALTDAMHAELYEAYSDLTLAFGLLTNANITVIGVGWFLGVIFLFYMLYPFFTFLIRSKSSAWITFSVLIVFYFIITGYFVPVKGCSFGSSNILYCAPYFVCGGVIFLYRSALRCITGHFLCKLLLVVLTGGYTVWFFVFPEHRVPLLSNLFLYSLWIVHAVSETGTVRKWTFLDNKLMKFLSGVSMEVYLCHMMFFRAVEKLHLENKTTDADFLYWTTCLIVFSGAVCFAVIWKRFEKKLMPSFPFYPQPKC